MIEGTRTYYLPKTDIEVEVTYEIQGEEVVFQYAGIGGNELDCDVLGLTIDVTEKHDLIRKTKQLTLKQWFQCKLDRDSCDIFDYHEIHVKSDHEEHFSQKDFL